MWLDSDSRGAADDVPSTRIQFLSEEYLALIKSDPDIAPFLSAGPNVRLLWKGVLYEIGQEGTDDSK